MLLYDLVLNAKQSLKLCFVEKEVLHVQRLKHYFEPKEPYRKNFVPLHPLYKYINVLI